MKLKKTEVVIKRLIDRKSARELSLRNAELAKKSVQLASGGQTELDKLDDQIRFYENEIRFIDSLFYHS